MLQNHWAPEHSPNEASDMSSMTHPSGTSISGATDAADKAADCEHAPAHWGLQGSAFQQHQHASEVHNGVSTIHNSPVSDVAADTSLLASTLLPWPDTDVTMDSQQQLLSDVLKISPSDAQLLLFSNQGASTLSQQQLSVNWATLQQLLPVEKHLLFRALLQLPDLLHQPQATINARLADAAEVLQIQQPRLHGRGRKPAMLRYQLLLMSQTDLQHTLVQLAQVSAHTSTRHHLFTHQWQLRSGFNGLQRALLSVGQSASSQCAWPYHAAIEQNHDGPVSNRNRHGWKHFADCCVAVMGCCRCWACSKARL
jgi:hypothetical protein